MTTLKGMLDTGPDGVPRLTAGQKSLLVRATHAALDRASSMKMEPDDVLSIARRVIIDALAGAIPSDRSCATCDYSTGKNCQFYEQGIPSDEIYEAGCDEHQTDGAPF